MRKLTHPTENSQMMVMWWVRKLTHPTKNDQVAWWVRCAYPPYGEMAMGFMVGALRLPTLEWDEGFVGRVSEAHPP
ncbi:hypothetical protein [Cronobacter turicensis]|uniref:hypothetical protein n=1 Tax=Cronobacter turicensis TaxID=413502 RepID=UPI0024C3ABED|nr:hypothetical protein [Cronobacter turicensis]MDK1235913.1 hypothetical protein [Cronobacter turicensis]